MAEIVAKRLVEHLERAGFVVMKRPRQILRLPEVTWTNTLLPFRTMGYSNRRKGCAKDDCGADANYTIEVSRGASDCAGPQLREGRKRFITRRRNG